VFKTKEMILGLLPMFAFANPGPSITNTPSQDQDGMEFAPNGNLMPGDGKIVGKAPNSFVSFWGNMPVVQPATTSANVHTPAAGSVTSVFVNTTFDGAFDAYTATIVAGSNLITMSSVTGLFVGMAIAGAGIPVGAVIGSINTVSLVVSLVSTLGQPLPATVSGAGVALTIGGTKAYTIGDIVTALKLAGLLAD
jgi:hypothetical protein